MNKEQKTKKTAGSPRQGSPAKSGVKSTTAKPSKIKSSKDINYHLILVKCTNGQSFYTYSTIGKKDELVSISAYTDPFVHEVWNKDKKRVISKDNPFTKRFGSLNFKKKEEE